MLCDFGKHRQAYVRPIRAELTDRPSFAFIAGEYDHPISLVACGLPEGWARDVSESIAREIAKTFGGSPGIHRPATQHSGAGDE